MSSCTSAGAPVVMVPLLASICMSTKSLFVGNQCCLFTALQRMAFVYNIVVVHDIFGLSTAMYLVL